MFAANGIPVKLPSSRCSSRSMRKSFSIVYARLNRPYQSVRRRQLLGHRPVLRHHLSRRATPTGAGRSRGGRRMVWVSSIGTQHLASIFCPRVPVGGEDQQGNMKLPDPPVVEAVRGRAGRRRRSRRSRCRQRRTSPSAASAGSGRRNPPGIPVLASAAPACRKPRWIVSMSPSSACSQLHSRMAARLRSALGQRGCLEVRQRRRDLARAHVGPDDAAALLRRGRPAPCTLSLKLDFGRLVRHVDAGARDVELPAVVDAAQAVLLVAAEEQAGAAVRAVVLRSGRPGRRCRGRRSGPRRAATRTGSQSGRGQLGREQRRHPVLAHQVAHRRAGADSGDVSLSSTVSKDLHLPPQRTN